MIDKYFNRTYSARDYNCAHFAVEVWRDLTGEDLGETLAGFLCAPSSRVADFASLRRVRFLARPLPLCLAYMQRPPGRPHVGIWYKGAVLHLLENSSVQYMPLEVAAVGFKRTRFFLCQ